jgi:AbrB family looped-hinge helix DNA binding protein
MKVADEVWTSVALLHKENPERLDFTVEEIKARAKRENWPIRPGFNVHASYHCLANKPANPANHRMLYEDSRGRKRLYRPGDPCHSEREKGKIHPDKQDLLPAYQSLVDWYEVSYSKQTPPAAAPKSGNIAHGSLPECVNGGLHSPDISEMQSRTAFVGSAGAVVIPDNFRKELGIQEGTCLSVYRENDRLVMQPITNEFIRSLVGCCKGEDSLVDARERDHRIEKR